MAFQRKHFQLPTLEDITRLSGALIFSKLDTNYGYWQIPDKRQSTLNNIQQSLQAILYFIRTPFSIKSAQEIFQKRVLGDLPGVETDIDNILA